MRRLSRILPPSSPGHRRSARPRHPRRRDVGADRLGPGPGRSEGAHLLRLARRLILGRVPAGPRRDTRATPATWPPHPPEAGEFRLRRRDTTSLLTDRRLSRRPAPHGGRQGLPHDDADRRGRCVHRREQGPHRAHHGVDRRQRRDDVRDADEPRSPASATAVKGITTNVTTLADDLRPAAGPNVPIIGSTYPDVILGGYVYPTTRPDRDGHPGQAVGRRVQVC